MSRRYVGSVIGAILGAVVGATIGGLVGRGIAFFGDETVEVAVPMAFCAILGYALGGGSGCKGALDRSGAPRATAGATVASLLLIVSVVAAAALGSDTVAVFLAVMAGGLVVAGLLAAAIAGAPRADAAAEVPNAAPKLEVTRRTVAPDAPPEGDPAATPATGATPAGRARRERPLRGTPGPEPEPAPEPAASPSPADARPRRTRPLRAGDSPDAE